MSQDLSGPNGERLPLALATPHPSLAGVGIPRTILADATGTPIPKGTPDDPISVDTDGGASVATEGTLDAVLAKMIASPATEAKQDTAIARLWTLGPTVASYRTGISAADIMATPAPSLSSVTGTLAANTYYVRIAAKNAYGRTVASTALSQAVAGGTTRVRATFAAVTGATHYDIWMSTHAEPYYLGRVTEAQRAAGLNITVAASATTNCSSTTSGVVAGAIDMNVAGTLSAQLATAITNPSGLVLPAATALVCTGYERVRWLLDVDRTCDGAAASLVVVPALSDGSSFRTCEPITLNFTSAGYSNRQILETPCRGAVGAHLLVQAIGGSGTTLDVASQLC